MGLLTEGAPLQWSEIEKHKDYIKKHGIIQFINLYNREKNRYDTEHKWGDEVEYTLVKFDDVNKTVKVSCRAAEILPRLQAEEELNNMLGMENAGYWRPEFASFQIEGSPGTPFGEDLSCFNDVESNLNERRKQVKRFLKKNESMMSISFPGLGAPNFTFPPMKPEPSQSIFFPNDAVNGAHPRYKTLMNIIKDRRGDKIDFHIPVFKDVKTPDPFYDGLGQGGECQSARADHIYLDHMGIGCGCCGLQVTMQTVNENECRWLYDQLTPLTPVFLALSAASPIFKSILSDLDCRWEALSASVDDRNREERGLSPLNKFPFKIDKRRLGTTDCYVHSTSVASNDLKILYDEEVYKTLLDGEIDEPLAKHIAHLFIRDPLVVYHERIIQDDEECSEHFETIQCTNWNNVRFKPPPSDIPEIGWRVEFRPTEVQLTDFETAAYCCFIVLLSRVIIHMKLNVIIPISMVDENMKRAQKRDAVLREKFFFRNNATYNATPSCNGIPDSTEAPEIEEYSIDEIINGKKNDFAGLIPLIRQYLDHENLEQANRTKMEEYLDFIGKRASGKINTLAKWMRNFVAMHPSYKKDSQVPTDTMYEMLKTMDDIAAGRKHCEKLLGSFRTKMTPLYERERKETTTSEFENSKDKINDIFMDSFDRKAFYELVEPKL